MTTIIVDKKNKTIYADRMQTRTMSSNVSGLFSGADFRNDTVYHEDTARIYQGNGIIMAGAGSHRLIQKAWDNSFLHGEPLRKVSAEDYNDSVMVTLIGNGDSAKVCIYTLKKNKSFWTRKVWYEWVCDIVPCTEGYIFLGSGGDYAEGAMSTGLVTPEEAIVAASKCDPYTDANVDKVEL